MISGLSLEQATMVRCAKQARFIVLVAMSFLLLSMLSSRVAAAEGSQVLLREFDIPEQGADDSIAAFAEQADLTLLIPFEVVQGVVTNKVSGTYTVETAIRKLLQGTRLKPVFSDLGELLNVAEDLSITRGTSMGERSKGLIAGLTAAILTTTVGGGLANAQETAGADQVIEEVVVTGSLIRRKDFETASPVQTVGRKEISDTGAFQMQDIFKGITANSGSQTSNRQNALQGLSQFSLRGLGIGSTLTLINGRRAGLAPITDSSGQLFTDSNQYPVNMIERIEVLTDGASSTYGSEAVAGVVNIYTRDDFEGFEISVEGRSASNESISLGSAFGAQGDRGGIAIFANYYTQDGNVRGDFDFIANGNRLAAGTASLYDSATGLPGRISVAVPSATAAGGFTRGTSTFADPDCVAAGGFIDGANCRYNFLN